MITTKLLPSEVRGQVSVPPSKSMAHRLLICAALAEGESVIHNVEYSNDITATVNALAQIGAVFTPKGGALHIRGTAGRVGVPSGPVNCGESGSTLRFLLPLLSLCGRPVRFTGAERLFQRPLGVYAQLFARQGLGFKLAENSLEICGALRAGQFSVPGDVSSQFISGLLFALSCMKEQSSISITGNFESESYVELTLNALEMYSIKAEKKEKNQLIVPGGKAYMPGVHRVEGDWSQAAALAAIGALQKGLCLTGLSARSRQGDRVFLNILEQCGARLAWQEQGLWVGPGEGGLHAPGRVDLADCPDLGPVLCAFLLFCQGKTQVVNAGRLRIKESDRIACVEQELGKFGGKIHSAGDSIFIEGGLPLHPGPPAGSHNDHRIVMALTVLALGAGLSMEIANSGAVAKSWPGFFRQLAEIGLMYTEEEGRQ